MVVSDLDGTMIGDDAATAAFKQFWETEAVTRGSLLVYNTGRALNKFEELCGEKSGCLAMPDVLISSVSPAWPGMQVLAPSHLDACPVCGWGCIPPSQLQQVMNRHACWMSLRQPICWRWLSEAHHALNSVCLLPPLSFMPAMLVYSCRCCSACMCQLE